MLDFVTKQCSINVWYFVWLRFLRVCKNQKVLFLRTCSHWLQVRRETILLKFYEKILHVRIKKIIEQGNLVSKHQFGFRNAHSTIDRGPLHYWCKNFRGEKMLLHFFLGHFTSIRQSQLHRFTRETKHTIAKGGFWFRGVIGTFFFENEQGFDRYWAMLNECLFTKIKE